MLDSVKDYLKGICCGKKRYRKETTEYWEAPIPKRHMNVSTDDLVSLMSTNHSGSVRGSKISTSTKSSSLSASASKYANYIDLTEIREISRFGSAVKNLSPILSKEMKTELNEIDLHFFNDICRYSFERRDLTNFPQLKIEEFSMFIKYKNNINQLCSFGQL